MKGNLLEDWVEVESIGKWTSKCDKLLHKYRVGGLCSRESGDQDFHVIRTHVLQALSFIKAHLSAQEIFRAEFANVDGNSLALAEKAVLDESKEQVSRAEAVLNAYDAEDVNAIKSQYLCQILLYKCADYFRTLAQNGLMSEREAGEFLDMYDRELRQLRNSSEMKSDIAYVKMSRYSRTLGQLDEIESDIEEVRKGGEMS